MLRGVQLAGAVTNADLAFESRRRAEDAPRILAEDAVVEQAVGYLMSQEGLAADAARARLAEAAVRAGVGLHVAAQAIVDGLDVR